MLKETLYQDIIRPLSEPELYKEYGVSPPNGMLLYGPPGCGKTYIAQRLAEEIGYHYIELKPSDLASTYIHETQEKDRNNVFGGRTESPDTHLYR